MIDREFKVKYDDGLIDVQAKSKEKRKGKFLHNNWISSLTETEALQLAGRLIAAIHNKIESNSLTRQEPEPKKVRQGGSENGN